MSRSEYSPESIGFLSAGVANLAFSSASYVSVSHRSTPERVNPLRTIDIAGIPDFFDHAGNFYSGGIVALACVGAGMLISRTMEEDQPRKITIAMSSAVGVGMGAGVNVAHEAGIPVPPLPAKASSEPFDTPDALFGSAAALIVAGTFCAVSLATMHRRHSRKSS